VTVGLPLFAALNARYGGYAGPLTPQQAAEKLAAGEAFLVDLRSDEARARDGVPDLRFKARGRAAALPASRGAELARTVAARTRNSGGVRNVRELEDATLATLAASLAAARAAADGKRGKKAIRKLPVIFLDGGGSSTDALRVARAAASSASSSPATRLGKPYILDGGFAAWSKAGLGVKSSSTYDVSPADALADAAAGLFLGSGSESASSSRSQQRAEAEAAVAVATGGDAAFARVVSQASPLSPASLKKAAGGSPLALGGAAGAAALAAVALLLHWRESLEFVGALGLLTTAARRLLAYESPAELAADAGGLLRAARGAVGSVASSSSSSTNSGSSSNAAALEAEKEREVSTAAAAASASAGEE